MTQLEGKPKTELSVHDKSVVFDVFGPELIHPERTLYPKSSEDFCLLEERLRSFRHTSPDTSIVLVDGAFDVPHPNHDWYLRHCRTLGAKLLLDKMYEPVNAHTLRKAVASKAVSLVVTVDADAKIQAKKGGLTEKGGIARPVYPWQLRAERIAGLTFDVSGQPSYVTNLVTVEGDPDHVATPLESSLTLAAYMHSKSLLDGLIVYGEHGQTVD